MKFMFALPSRGKDDQSYFVLSVPSSGLKIEAMVYRYLAIHYDAIVSIIVRWHLS